MTAPATGRAWPVSAGLLAVVGIALPVGALEGWVLASGGPADAGIGLGLWLSKGALLLVAAWVYGVGRLGSGAGAPSPRAASGFATGTELDPRRAILMLGMLLAVATALRLVQLGAGLWLDEIITLVDYVRRPWPGVITAYDSDNNHLLYSLAARISTSLLGEGAGPLRLPAVVMGVASIAAAWDFTRRVGSREEALLVAAFLTVSFHHVWFSQNARGYTGLMLFTLLSSSALLDLLEVRRGDDGRPAALRYAVYAALGAYLHLTGLFAMAAHGVVGLTVAVRRKGRDSIWIVLGLLGSGLIAGALYAPVLPQLVETLFGGGGGGGSSAPSEWQGIGWLVTEMLNGLARGLPGGWAALVVGGVLGGVGVIALGRRTPAALAVMLLPAVIGMGVLLATSRNLWPRFFFFLGAFGVLIAVRGVRETLRWALGAERGERLALLGLTLAVVGSAVLVPRAWGPKQDFESAIGYVDGVAAADDAIVVAGVASFPVNRYYARNWPTVATVAELEAVEARHDVVRVIFTFPIELESSAPGLAAYLREHYRPAEAFGGTIGSGEVMVWIRDSMSSGPGP